ncbi:glycosyltransferase [Carnobacterium mobile]|uniref:glycosyltransferase n=1 Tax=Carnobacterium mobile TaxID=2750 RepID=UPI000554C778|nr:glycosyltransferase [Carnobacterium mobile]
MIFITVGTHEQQFNRLIRYIDDFSLENNIEEEIIIQSGYSDYNTKNCKTKRLLSYNEMITNVEKARIIITHGGPSSIMMPLQIGKVPIVVPRKYENNEHVNNHQVSFLKALEERQANVIPIYDINDLGQAILDYDIIVEKLEKGVTNNNEKFNNDLSRIINKIVNKK